MAKARNMTVSQFVEQVFRDYIAEQESQNKLKRVS